MSDNLALWNAVEKTDPAHVKTITGKAYRGTSPKPHYLIHKATETFGPCGIGWGFEIVDEKILDGALLAEGFYERIHMARVRVWYDWSGKRGTVEHVGQTAFSGRRKSGDTYTDEDAPKKSVTDALVKALSMIGFAGDIFMGRYDDNKYVADLAQEMREEKNGRKIVNPETGRMVDPNSANQAKKRGDWPAFQHELSECGSAVSLAALQLEYQANIYPHWPKSWAKGAEEEFEKRLAEFSQGDSLKETLEDSVTEERAEYIRQCHDHIDTIATVAGLAKWWDGEKGARRRIGLEPEELAELMDRVKVRRDDLLGARAAPEPANIMGAG